MMLSSIRPWIKFTGVVFYLLWYFTLLIIVSRIAGKSQKRGFRIRRKFCLSALRILGIEYQKEGKLFPGVCLYVSNHRSMLDPLIELSWLNAFILSKAEVRDYPILGRGAKETGVLFVDRQNDRSRKMALTAIEETLKSQFSVLIYPEGTTHSEDLTGDFRKGALELAFDLGIPVVPVMIEYPDHSYYWSSEKLLEYFVRVFRSPVQFKVKGKIGEQIICSERKDIVKLTRDAIDNMIIEARQ